ncbi:hypothetical protein TH53_18610 [Pedobacter lusitanus]|uniref:SAF domain-containing protein n=1 Tax=Pedobacter lusitanus TaxID=1503925 RepID=A0A0D0GET6_9SPHI|nr:UxaA family hydrolase [Pedobacter lusitanus]KIO75797.1 hypothetical protein TH53_18610 [Pedobacter lusitanus]
MNKLIQLHPDDNVQIVVEQIEPGDLFVVNNRLISATQSVPVGHKIAIQLIGTGQKIIKYGVAIGSATTKINAGTPIHLHNMKSDYIPTYTIEDGFKENNT